VSRTVKLAIAALAGAIAIGLVIAYVPRVKTMLTFRSEEGRAASQRGNFTTIVELWRPLAELGDAVAQDRLGAAYERSASSGEMYAKGRGVPQNLVVAHQWLNLAATNGADGAAELRDELAARMTAAQIAEAQTFASGWKPRKW
jgi:uncharacterized protein